MSIRLKSKKEQDEFFKQNPTPMQMYDKPIGPERPEPKKEPAPSKKSTPDAETSASREPNKANWREKLSGAARTVGEKARRLNAAVQERHRKHPSDERRERRPRTKKQRRQVSRIDRYDTGGHLVESTHFAMPSVPARRPSKQQRQEPRGHDPWTDGIPDFNPMSMDPFGISSSSKKKGRRNDWTFDIMDRVNSVPW